MPVAHKTGEDDDLSNDGVREAQSSRLSSALRGHDTKASQFEDLMRHGSADLS